MEIYKVCDHSIVILLRICASPAQTQFTLLKIHDRSIQVPNLVCGSSSKCHIPQTIHIITTGIGGHSTEYRQLHTLCGVDRQIVYEAEARNSDSRRKCIKRFAVPRIRSPCVLSGQYAFICRSGLCVNLISCYVLCRHSDKRYWLRTMQDYLEAPPCPLNKTFQQEDILSWQNPSKHEYLTSTLGESTENIKFTTELQTAFRQAAPRQRNIIARKDNPIKIYEDKEGSKPSQRRTDPVGNHQGAGLVGVTKSTSRSGLIPTSLKSLNTTGRGFPEAKGKNVGIEDRGSRVQDGKGPPEKEARRRNIYLPTRDVSKKIKRSEAISDVHHPAETRFCEGGFSYHTRGASSEQQRLRRDPVTAARKRGVLQAPLKILQEQCAMTDRPGRKTGKENVPPGQRLSSVHKKSGKDGGGLQRSTRSSRLVTTGHFSTPGGSNRIGSTRECDETFNRLKLVSSSVLGVTAPVQGPCLKVLSPQVSDRYLRCQKSQKSCSGSKSLPASHIGRPSKPDFSIAIPRPTTYFVLREKISQHQIYEQVWLNYQETAMTELINALFLNAKALNTHRQADTKALRREMMEIYQSTSMQFLYKRLQASLRYGSLNRPRGTLFDHSRTLSDVGFRQQFVELWTKTYCPLLLTAAAEVVTGHEFPVGARTAIAFSPSRVMKGRASARDLEGFIESCLLRNEDACHPTDDNFPDMNQPQNVDYLSPRSKSALGSWRRTLQRCFMIVVLIDNAKASGLITKKVFRKSSKHKSSHAVLGQLTALLMPWAGDVTRHLSHLGYHISHVQLPLADYQFLIKSLALDLRDGVRLTHLIGLLLYPPTQLTWPPGDITISLPLADVLTTNAVNRSEQPLLHHVKYPCQERASRLHNVQIALGALEGVSGVKAIVDGIRPEDVVDGHREKTMILIWGLMGTRGLDALIDGQDLLWEYRKQRGKAKQNGVTTFDSDGDLRVISPGMQTHTRLLKAWAMAVAWNHGLRHTDLETSLTSGKVFECIVNEYYMCIVPATTAQDMILDRSSLPVKLERLGCSRSFGKLLFLDFLQHSDKSLT